MEMMEKVIRRLKADRVVFTGYHHKRIELSCRSSVLQHIRGGTGRSIYYDVEPTIVVIDDVRKR